MLENDRNPKHSHASTVVIYKTPDGEIKKQVVYVHDPDGERERFFKKLKEDGCEIIGCPPPAFID